MSWLNVISFCTSFIIIGISTVFGLIIILDSTLQGISAGTILMAILSATIVNLVFGVRKSSKE